ncbi:MAG TPA: pyrroline-5-carboxylate reductase [Phycisphaerae bacterium]|nr:pyrroline-5-carboxylate reductase [Phycisphaerae bacterium]
MPTIGFIGAGNMAEAIARGLLRSALYRPNEIRATDPNPERQKLFVDDLGIPCTSLGASCHETAGKSDVIVLATKPFVIAEALKQLAPNLKPDALIISIAAGISCKFIEETLGNNPRVIRVMPNTPMLAGKGMSALARGAHATEADLITAERIFASAGKTVRVAETEMDAVTAVSGSGPAYIFLLAEALTEAAKAAGLSDSQAAALARETVIGAATLLEQSKDSAQELRRKVTTPNGTTQAAIETLQAGGFAELMTKAVAAAAKRSMELGK